MKNVPIEKAQKDKLEIAKKYNIPISTIVWIGDNHYIIVKNGIEIKF